MALILGSTPVRVSCTGQASKGMQSAVHTYMHLHELRNIRMQTPAPILPARCTCRLHEELLRAQGVLPSSNPALGVNRFREETAPVPQYLRAVGAPLPRAAGTGVHKTVQRDIEQLLAGRDMDVVSGLCLLSTCRRAVHFLACKHCSSHVAAVCAHLCLVIPPSRLGCALPLTSCTQAAHAHVC